MLISIQTGGIIEKFSPDKCYDFIKNAGFEAIDWNGVEHACPRNVILDDELRKSCIFRRPIDEVMEYFKEELDAIYSRGLKITQAHAPFPSYVAGRPEILDDMIEINKKVIEVCDRVGCKRLVIHGISLAAADTENTPETVKALNYRLYESLIPTLLKCDVTVCLENLFSASGGPVIEGTCTDPYEAVKYIDDLNALPGREVFGFSLDTGNIRLLKKDFRSYIPVLGKRIKCLHIHDNDGATDAHLAPMAGNIFWNHFLDALNGIGYDGDLNFEVFMQSLAALKVNEDMLGVVLRYVCEIGKNFRNQIEK